MKKTMITSCVCALALAGCSSQTSDSISAKAGEPVGTLTSGIYLENIDHSVRPQENFYRFINGKWLDRTEIPADRARWGSFDELREQAEKHVLEIVLEAANSEHLEFGSDMQKIGDLYTSFMDTERIEALRLQPLESEFDRINQLASHTDLPVFWGQSMRYRYGMPFSAFVGVDQRQSDQYITSASQAGLGLPDRDFYVVDSDQNLMLRNGYKNYIAQVWELAGWENGEAAAETIVALETKLAQHHWTRVQNRDRNATYNKVSFAELSEMAPGFDWMAFFETAGLGHAGELVIRQPDYFTAFAHIHTEIPLDDWKKYLKFHLIRANSSMLSSDFDEANFNFYGRLLSGVQEQRSREKRGVSTVESVLGFMVGKKYVERHFPAEASARMDELIDNFMVAFEQSIKELEWMGEETKQEALLKLSNFTHKIGYPEVWRDYECIEIHPDDLIGNMRRAALCEYERNINRLGTEVDRTEWGMTPQTVNAYYSPTLNEIVFPAAILQPPFFDVNAEDAVNYGAIGAVIGHEISHGFDDQGRRSDGEGNLRDWWTPEDEAEFNRRAQLMIDQYNAFNPIDDMTINGALALGENIADLGGMNVAYRAYQNSLNGRPSPVIDGYTGEQRLFMGWGQIWRIKFRDEALRRQLITGPHSPGKYRVLGILSNMPEFYEAFDVQPGDGMYREEEVRVKIW